MKRIPLLLSVLLFLAQWGRAGTSVILFIGDGMGPAQVAAARFELKGADGRLAMETLPVTGIVCTHSADKLVTDSAAAGTALACGRKTNNGMLGMLPDGRPLKSVLKLCRDAGMATGLIATSSITHATPASFAANMPSRGDEADIAKQMINGKIDVLLGGGTAFFLPKSDKGSKRKDDLDLLKQARDNGYSVIRGRKELKAFKGRMLLGLFAPEGLKTGGDEPGLADMTLKALEILRQDEDGFFLMVEGSQVDWACHANDAKDFFRQMGQFDSAVATGFEFAKKDGRTLVVVTADHETGGMTIEKGDLKKGKLDLEWEKKGHTASPVMLFAYGPGSGAFTGVMDNTDVPKKIAKAAGLGSLD